MDGKSSDGETGTVQFSDRGLLAGLRNVNLWALLPAVILGAYWVWGEAGLISACVAGPALVALTGIRKSEDKTVLDRNVDGLTGLALRGDLVAALDKTLKERSTTGLSTACLIVEIDEFKELKDRNGHTAAEAAIRDTAIRLSDVMRDADVISRLDGATFAVMLAPVRSVDLEAVIQISSRIQSALGEPIRIDDLNLYVSCSIGFCLTSRTPEDTGKRMLMAAESAMIEARRNGPGAIRSYSKEMKQRFDAQQNLVEDVRVALEVGQIAAWYQPQISTETGEITGFEALARWSHPERGLIPPAEFLPAIEQSGLNSRLGEVMLYNALTAIKNWEKVGFQIPSVAVNFSESELRDPKLMEKIKWELDRFDLTPDRLTVEILENVIADAEDDVIPQNIRMLSHIGCRFDLDDFGTGHASIAAIRRFAVNRIKIDRSFVSKIDEDQDQQKMLAAILMMAERLELEALAEGVESLGERSVLSQLGCQHIQGYGIARPMPFNDTLVWIKQHNDKLVGAPTLFGGKSGKSA